MKTYLGELKYFPMPPSTNVLYGNRKNGGRGPTKAYFEYKRECNSYKLTNLRQINCVIKRSRDYLSLDTHNMLFLALDMHFFYKKIFTLDDRQKILDPTNRLKAPLDIISGKKNWDLIDDKFFNSSQFKAVSKKKFEYLTIRFFKSRIKE